MEQELRLSENSLRVLERRYLAKDDQARVVEKPRELFWRVAKAIASADTNYGATEKQIAETAEEFFGAMSRLEFLPNSPTLMNAGRALGQLSACFVLPVGDSMEDIFEAIKHAAIIHKSGGGTGFAFSRLRPKSDVVRSTMGVASGPVSFMKVFNAATEAVKQGGTRRGANMGILRVDHPDILDFISCKDDTSEITNFNISVAITDEFMSAVQDGTRFNLRNPRTGAPHKMNGDTATLDAREVFELIVEHAWRTGEPGVVFIDRMNANSPTCNYEEIEATNPCGEQPLPPYDSCNLGSINLGGFVRDPLPDGYDPVRDVDAGVDWDQLGVAVKQAVHFLDNVIDLNRYPLPQIGEQTRSNRRIGLGVMGWADMLVRLRVPYNSEEAFDLGGRVMKFVQDSARVHSSDLAKQRGTFPNWEKSAYAQENVTMRNATVTTVAPTGTISIIAGCSSGIEPYFAVSFVRNVMDGAQLVDVNPHFERIARERGFFSEDLMERIAQSNSIQGFDEVPDDVRRLFVTAADVTPEQHVRMQAVFQQHCDSAVSKTINMPNSATTEDVRTAYLTAYRLGCKGVTVYRDGSRIEQVLTTGATAGSTPMRAFVQERPESLIGVTEKIRTGYGNLYVTVNSFDKRPFEVFAQIGKSGFSTMADTEAICRLISLALRSGISVDDIVDQLQGIGGSTPVFQRGEVISSIPDAIAKVLKRHFGNGDNRLRDTDVGQDSCVHCGTKLIWQEGCLTCPGCGESKCS